MGELLPAAREGLAAWGVDSAQADRLLDIIERRCLTGRTGASWQVATVRRLTEGAGHRMDRHTALQKMLSRYLVHMHANSPVHTWPLD